MRDMKNARGSDGLDGTSGAFAQIRFVCEHSLLISGQPATNLDTHHAEEFHYLMHITEADGRIATRERFSTMFMKTSI